MSLEPTLPSKDPNRKKQQTRQQITDYTECNGIQQIAMDRGFAVPHEGPMLRLRFVKHLEVEPCLQVFSPSLTQQSCWYSWSMRFVQCEELILHQHLRR